MVVTVLKNTFCSRELALSNSVIVFLILVVVSMEINSRLTFRETYLCDSGLLSLSCSAVY